MKDGQPTGTTPRIGERVFDVPVGGKSTAVPAQIDMRWGLQFSNRKRRSAPPDSIIVHDNAGPGNPSEYFEGKGFGVHFFIELDGRVWFHCDPEFALVHGGAWNGRTVAVELRNGFTWNFRHALQTHHTNTRLAAGRKMPFYTPAQMEALVFLVSWLWEAIPSLVRAFPNVKDEAPLHRFVAANHPPGVVAHYHSLAAHADGTIPVAVAYYVLEGDLDIDEAMERVAREAGDGLHLTPEAARGAFRPLGPRGAPDDVRCPNGACKGGGGKGGGKGGKGAPPKGTPPPPKPSGKSNVAGMVIGTVVAVALFALGKAVL